MNFKKILASVAAAALAVSSMAVCSFAADGLSTAPEGEENVLTEFVKAPDQSNVLAQWGSVWYSDSSSSAIPKEGYIKISLSSLGDYDDGQGVITPFDDFLSWNPWSWATFLKVYNTAEDWEVTALPIEGATKDAAIVYVPVADVKSMAFNIQAGHIPFTVDKVELVEFNSASGGDTPSGDDENEEVTIMDTPTELKDDWSVSVQIDLSNYTFKAGDKITITYEKSDGGQLQPKYNDNGWPTLPGVTDDANADSSWGGYNLTGAEGTLVYTLTEEDVENISANGNILIIGGQKVTVSKVTLTSASSTDEGDDDDDDGDNTSGIPATPSGGNSSSENTTASEATAAPEETAASENVSDTAVSEDTEASETAPEDTSGTSVVVEPGPVETTSEETTAGDSNNDNPSTGIVLAVIPAAAAAAGVTAAASRKRK